MFTFETLYILASILLSTIENGDCNVNFQFSVVKCVRSEISSGLTSVLQYENFVMVNLGTVVTDATQEKQTENTIFRDQKSKCYICFTAAKLDTSPCAPMRGIKNLSRASQTGFANRYRTNFMSTTHTNLQVLVKFSKRVTFWNVPEI
uniref:AlNc14C126G6810 protein n=1 Tax=Albugo laibachii Nc14 TaxID=890382 RepID=F0WJU0_9STRA|nr:AlNc14C126G6810 [Albugo laibachii Nc14]|eukprot:CCA21542.1 AlNc14C126G6810 [Albugo laibachii Nc14]